MRLFVVSSLTLCVVCESVALYDVQTGGAKTTRLSYSSPFETSMNRMILLLQITKLSSVAFHSYPLS